MLCYKDMSFCSAAERCDTPPEQCGRKLTKDEASRAIKLGLPVSWSDFSPSCTIYTPKEVENG